MSNTAGMHVAAEPIAMQQDKSYKNEDDIKKIDMNAIGTKHKVDKTKNNDAKNKNKTIKKNLESKLKEIRNKKAAAQEDKSNKNVRKITEFIKPKSEHPRSQAIFSENLAPGAAIAGYLASNLGPENVYSGDSRKQENHGKLSQPSNWGLVEADCDWPDGLQRTRLSQSK